MVDSSMVMERLEAVGTPLTQPSGAVLFDQGQPGEGAYVLKSGSTRLSLSEMGWIPLTASILASRSVVARATISAAVDHCACAYQ